MSDSRKIEVKCNHCGSTLMKKNVPGRKAEKGYYLDEIKCQNCGTVNINGIPFPVTESHGERLVYSKKD